jgi:serine O-acetyltransferase
VTAVRARDITADPETVSQLFALLREDWAAHSPRPLAKPGFHALALHRFGYWQRRLPKHPRRIARVLHDAAYFVTRVVYGIELPRTTRVGRRVVIGHQGGIVIGTQADIGDDCLIRQNVTIGAAEDGGQNPRIGDRVGIGAGAVIVGGIVIGDDAVIGPNAVVGADVPPGARVVAPPARILGRGLGETGTTAPSGVPSPLEVLALLEEIVDTSIPLASDTPLLSSGIVDSLALAALVSSIEDRYSLTIDTGRVTKEEFDSAQHISALVAELTARR